jgi:hypothetical protein
MFTGMPDFHQSIEMMKNMWSTAAKTNTDGAQTNFGLPGMSTLNPFGIPTVDIEELDKRIKDLKSVEAWLSLNLNVLQTTIQGLEVQRATLATLQGIADTMRASTNPTEKASPTSGDRSQTTTADFASAGGKLAQDLMEQMSKSMTNMMSAFPSGAGPKTKTPRKTPAKKAPTKTTAAKTTKSRSNPTGA